MNALNEIIERARLLVEHHVSHDIAVPAFVGVIVGLIIVGLGLSVLGAKLARGSLTALFCVTGAGAGLYMGRLADVPSPVAGLLGAAILGVVGFALHRVWVGVAAGLVVVVGVNATYGARTLGPEFREYAHNQGTMPAVVSPLGDTFTVPEPDVQAAALNPEFQRWARGFWDYAFEHDRGGTRRVALTSACAALFGMLMGVFAVRFTLVTTTAVVGTAMFGFGILSAARTWRPDFYQAGVDHPQALAAACGTFLLASLLLQTLLTKPHNSAGDAGKKS